MSPFIMNCQSINLIFLVQIYTFCFQLSYDWTFFSGKTSKTSVSVLLFAIKMFHTKQKQENLVVFAVFFLVFFCATANKH